ncbi:ABC transporter substrate-binding protein [Bradyrhizobium sp. AUGA SZCCT0160]|uniref:ABC transporter substrate-binding protein n=1 Tax=Bradyrhizobium sp. AUGA SZCCT0160 TaxID=2807662 RepID=UPI001BA8584D|nr:ABC transporter substrate-binding protein [Bradyrhizobium sp. AUGA SZCCT0160]MBR1192165.1 ABC transporter substrate-binding protein [Bradyrhizobium sp. AUGA SZCCT0160]
MIRKFGLIAAVAVMTVATTGDLSAAEKKYGPGVTDTEIKLGQTVPYSGPASAFSSYGRVMTGYFKMVNEAGGINGRKINMISLDNAFSPPKAIEQTRKLVENDEVLADVGTVGTTPNVAIQKYLNGAKVPHIFVSAGGRRFADPQNFPWTVPMYPGFEMEGKTFGQYILKHKPAAKIGVLYQNDDYGKDFLVGLKAGLGDKIKIVAEVTYEITEPTIDSQIVRLKDSGADTLLYFSTPKFTAQGLRKVKETGWTPLQFLASPTNSVKTVLEPAGFDNAQGIITTQFTKQAGDPAWADDAEVKEYVEFMKKWVPNDNPGDFVALSGYVNVQGIVKAITKCGDDLTRENLLKQATSMKGTRLKMMLPGIQLNTTPQDYAPYESLRMAKFEGSSWKLIDEVGTSASAR